MRTQIAVDGRPVPAPFLALPPGRLPTADTVRRDAGATVLEVVACYLDGAEGLPHVVAAAQLGALGDRLPASAVAGAPGGDDGAKAGMAADFAEHDRYFRIRRVAHPAGAPFLRSVILAARLFHVEMECAYGGGDPDGFGAVGAGFDRLLRHLAGLGAAPLACRAAQGSDGAGTVVAMDRWIIGHQVFAVLTQGIVVALLAFEGAMQAADDLGALDGMGLAADLLLASAAAFRFTADFPPTAYRDVIRPTMAPPYVGKGFSGLLSSDHCALVQVMTKLRPAIAEAAARHPAAHARLTHALQHVYDDHKFVCARFDGAAGPSLRGQACTGVHGVELLDRFKHARLRLLRPGAPSKGIHIP